jgi:hypothetical protein
MCLRAGGAPGSGGPPRTGGTGGPLSRWAVASFAAGLVGLFPLGIGAGITAVARMRRRGQRGMVLAVGGLAMSGAWVLVTGLAVAAAGGPAGVASLAHAAAGPAREHPAAGARLDVLTLPAGDCFDSPPGPVPATVAVLPCARPHSAQVFARFRLAGPDLRYPGQAAVERLARRGCGARDGDIGGQGGGQGLVPAGLTVRLLFPLAGPWLTGQRAVSCVIVSPRHALTRSLVGS